MSRQNGAAAHGTAPRNAREFKGFSLNGGEGFCAPFAGGGKLGTGLFVKAGSARRARFQKGFLSVPMRAFAGHTRDSRRPPDFPLCGCGFRRGFAQAVFPGFALLCAANSAKGGISAFRERRIRGARGSAIPSICPRPVSRKSRRYRRLKLSTPLGNFALQLFRRPARVSGKCRDFRIGIVGNFLYRVLRGRPEGKTAPGIRILLRGSRPRC